MNFGLRHRFLRERFLVNMTKSQEYDMKIDRTSDFGNHKYKIGRDGTREEVVQRFFEDLKNDPQMILRMKKELYGKRLGCWCFPKLCHGDMIIKMVYGV